MKAGVQEGVRVRRGMVVIIAISIGLAYNLQMLLYVLQASLDPEYAILVRWNDYGEALPETILLIGSMLLLAYALILSCADVARG